MALGGIPLGKSKPQDAGFGHCLSIIFGNYMADAASVYDNLMHQLSAGKEETWRQRKDKEFGLHCEDCS